MDGWPVWLASVSYRPRGEIVATERWTSKRSTLREGEALIDRVLGERGDRARQREFRMNVTLCRHRALTETERDSLPAWWHEAPALDIAGGPVEVLWYRGIREAPSTLPCRRPKRKVLNLSRPDLWLPVDCGSCEPCLARAACHPANSGDRVLAPPDLGR